MYIGEIITVMESDTASRDTIRRLENELAVYKRAYADLDADRHRVEMLKLEADKRKEDLENQLKVNLFSKVCLGVELKSYYPGPSNHCTFRR